MVEIKMETLCRPYIGVLLLFILFIKIHADETMNVNSFNCRRKPSVDLDVVGAVYLRYIGAPVSDCEILLKRNHGTETCFKITKFVSVPCGTIIKYKHYSTTLRSHDCHSITWGDEYCSIYSKLAVTFDTSEYYSYSGGDITVKVYTQDNSVNRADVFGKGAMTTAVVSTFVIATGAIVGCCCLIFAITCCCCYRKRSHLPGRVVRNQQQSTGVTAYPAAYQPGYQSGCPPPPQGGYPAQQTAFAHAPAGYQPSGYPPQLSGYPAQGYSQPDEPEKHKLMESAPPLEEIQMRDMPQPPPYPGN